MRWGIDDNGIMVLTTATLFQDLKGHRRSLSEVFTDSQNSYIGETYNWRVSFIEPEFIVSCSMCCLNNKRYWGSKQK
jgi:hypothetical protein